MNLRVIINIGFLISILLLPWWVAVILAVAGIFFIDRYYELVIWGGIYDVMFGVPSTGFHYWGIVFGTVLFLLSFWLKKSLARNM